MLSKMKLAYANCTGKAESEDSDDEVLDPAQPDWQTPTEPHERGGVRASVKADMGRRREKQMHEGLQRAEDMRQLEELEKNAADWSQINDKLKESWGPRIQTLQGKQEREGLLRQIRGIDPNYGTGLPGSIKSIRKKALRIRVKHFVLVVQSDGEEEWLEKRKSQRLTKPQGNGCIGEDSNDAQDEMDDIGTSD